MISTSIKCIPHIRNFSTCGVISEFSTSVMWRNLKFVHICHVDIFRGMVMVMITKMMLMTTLVVQTIDTKLSF